MTLRTRKPTREERAAMTHDELLRAVWLLDEVIELFQWIPVEERLPEEGVEVLVTRLGTRGPYVTTDEYQDEFGWESDGYVIAWMPLPEPYRPDALLEAGAEAGQYADAPTLRSAT